MDWTSNVGVIRNRLPLALDRANVGLKLWATEEPTSKGTALKRCPAECFWHSSRRF